MAKKPVSRYKPGQLSRAPRPAAQRVEEKALPVRPAEKIEKTAPVPHENPEVWKHNALQKWKNSRPQLKRDVEISSPLGVHERETVKHVLSRMMVEATRLFPKDKKIIEDLIQNLAQRTQTIDDLFQEPERLKNEMASLNRSYNTQKHALFNHLIFIGTHWRKAAVLAGVAMVYSRQFKDAQLPSNPEHIASWLGEKNPTISSREEAESFFNAEFAQKTGQSWIEYQAKLMEKRRAVRNDPENLAREDALRRAMDSFSDVMLPPSERRKLEEEARTLIQRRRYSDEHLLRRRALFVSFDETVHQLTEMGISSPSKLMREIGADTTTPRGIDKLKTVQRIVLQTGSLAIKKRLLRKLAESQRQPTELKLNRMLGQLNTIRKLDTRHLDLLKSTLLSSEAKQFRPGAVARALRLWVQIEMATRLQDREIDIPTLSKWITYPNAQQTDLVIQELVHQGVFVKKGEKVAFSRSALAQIPRFDIRTTIERTGIKGKQRQAKIKWR